MSNRENILETILKEKIIVAIRNVYGDDLLYLSDALLEGGIKVAEVTFNLSDKDCIRKNREALRLLSGKKDLVLGAGTVLNVEQLRVASEEGVSFAVSPNCNRDVIRKTREYGLISVPGGFTPTEIEAAYEAGADIVKFFPSSAVAPSYIKDIKAPLGHVRIFASGGINSFNAGEYLKAGCSGVFVSSYLASADLIRSGNFKEITERARSVVGIVKEVSV